MIRRLRQTRIPGFWKRDARRWRLSVKMRSHMDFFDDRGFARRSLSEALLPNAYRCFYPEEHTYFPWDILI